MSMQEKETVVAFQSLRGSWNILVGILRDLGGAPYLRHGWFSSSLWGTKDEALADLYARHPETASYRHETFSKNSSAPLLQLVRLSKSMSELPDVFFRDMDNGVIDFRDRNTKKLLLHRDQAVAISWLTLDEPDFDLERWLQLPEALRNQLVSDAKPGGDKLSQLLTENFLLPESAKAGFWHDSLEWGYNLNTDVFYKRKEFLRDSEATAEAGHTSVDSLFTEAAYKFGLALDNDDEAVGFISHHAAQFLWIAVTPTMVNLGLREASFQSFARKFIIAKAVEANPSAEAELQDSFKAYDEHATKTLFRVATQF